MLCTDGAAGHSKGVGGAHLPHPLDGRDVTSEQRNPLQRARSLGQLAEAAVV